MPGMGTLGFMPRGARRDAILMVVLTGVLVVTLRPRVFFLPDGSQRPFGTAPGCTVLPLALVCPLLAAATFAVAGRTRIACGEGRSAWR